MAGGIQRDWLLRYVLILQIESNFKANYPSQVKKTIPLFEFMYPGAVAEFIFDQSSAHGAFAPDALNAKEMNMGSGGNQRRMHDTVIPDNNPDPLLRGKPQSMVFPEDLPPSHPYYEYRGKAKGMRIVLEERGFLAHISAANGGKRLLAECANCKMSQQARDKLARETAAATNEFSFDADSDDEDAATEDAVHPSSTCCMRRVISLQQDFINEKPLLQIIIEEAGHKCYFLPKFHCELNPIEMYWGWVKIRESVALLTHSIYRSDSFSGMRALADGTFPTGKRLVPELLDACPVNTIRAFVHKAWRYMDAYMYVSCLWMQFVSISHP